MNWGDSFVAFDTETTGLGSDARIIEIAFVRFEGGEIAENWSTFLKPNDVKWDDPGVQKALEVNKINVTDLFTAPTFMDVFHHVAAHLRSADVWVAHNAEFDLRMLDQEHKAHKQTPFPIAPKLCLCTKVLSGRIHPSERKHNLQFVAPRWGVQQDGAHRAASDAITCGRILHAMRVKNALPAERSEVEEFHKQASVDWNSKFGGRRR
jgi:DNA polymerase-3 subunit epsilon